MSGKKKGKKLKNMELTSVDLVNRGANPDAHICLFKSAEGEPSSTPPNPPASTNKTEPSVLKGMLEAIKNALFPDEAVNKEDAKTFNDVTAVQELNDSLWKYMRAFEESVSSIVRDDDVDAAQKSTLLNDTLEQFNTKMKSLFPDLAGVAKGDDDEPGKVDKSTVEGDDDNMEFDINNIDMSALSAEDQATFQALAKQCKPKKPTCKVDPEDKSDPEDMDDEDKMNKKGKKCKKSDVDKGATDPAFAAALQELENLKKGYESAIEKQEKDHELEVAKKYVNLGKKPEELAETLYALKKSGEDNYNAYIAVLDESLELIDKSGLFKEIGKTVHGDVGSDVEAKLAGIAKGFMKEDPKLDFYSAMVKACDENPKLRKEYEEL